MSLDTPDRVTTAQTAPVPQEHATPADRSGGPELFGAPWPLRWRTAGVLAAWAAAMVAVFTVVGEVLVRTPIADADQDLARDVVDRRTETLDSIAPWAAGLSDTIVKIAATTIIVGVMFWAWRRWLEPLIVAVSLIFEATVFMVTTTIVGRPRPEVDRLQESPVNSSWPSGHVAAAAAYGAIAVVLTRHVRTMAAKVAIWASVVAVTLVVAAARIYQGMHFASDVVGGIALGAVSVAIVTVTLDRAAATRTAPEPDRS